MPCDRLAAGLTSKRRADERTNLDRCRRAGGARGAHRGTRRDGRIHVAEARDRRRRRPESSSRRRSTPTTTRRQPCVIFAPSGTQLTTNQAPGTVLGPVTRDREGTRPRGRRSSARGPARRRRSRPGAAATQTACIGTAHAARHVVDGALGGGTDADRSHVPRLDGRHADGARPCVHPDLPPAARRPGRDPGRATFGAKVYSAELTINGVFSRVAVGAWISSWVPYSPARASRTAREPSSRRPRSHPAR